MFKKIFISFIFISFPVVLLAQQMPLYSQYMLNGFIFNPATAGHDGLTTLNLTTRQQWVGVENAPRSVAFNIQTRVLMRNFVIKRDLRRGNRLLKARKGRVGLGVNIYNDRNGLFNQSGANFTYAYHIPFPNSQLSFGLSASITQFKINVEGLKFRDSDLKFLQLGDPIYVPDANAGVFYENNTFYCGVSAANLLQSKVKYGNPNLDSYQLKRHYFVLAGYRWDDIRNLSFEPAIMIKTTETLYPQVDLSFKTIYNQNYWLGISYRTVKSFIAFVGITRNNFSAGYAYDYDFNSFQKFTYGSHELNMSLRFGDTAKRYRWLRRF